MSENLKDILSNLNPGASQEALLQYLQGKLTAEQQHELEKQLLQDEFEAEALEGLEGFQNKQAIQDMVEGLNKELRKKTEKKKKFRQRMTLGLDPWVIITIVFILVLVALGYYVIFRLTRG
jgi:hypothetical protein